MAQGYQARSRSDAAVQADYAIKIMMIKSSQIKIVLLTAANTVKGMEGQKKSDILHHP